MFPRDYPFSTMSLTLYLLLHKYFCWAQLIFEDCICVVEEDGDEERGGDEAAAPCCRSASHEFGGDTNKKMNSTIAIILTRPNQRDT